MIRPAVLLAVLVPLHLVAQRLLLGRVVPPLLALPVLAVAAYEVMHRLVARRAVGAAAARRTPPL